MLCAALLLKTNSPGVRSAGTVSEPEMPPPEAFFLTLRPKEFGFPIFHPGLTMVTGLAFLFSPLFLV